MMGSNFVKRNRHIGWVREEYESDRAAALARKEALAPTVSDTIYDLEPVESELPADVRAKLQSMAAEQMQSVSDALLASMWPKPLVKFEDSVWPPKPQPRCACGKCYGIIIMCGNVT